MIVGCGDLTILLLGLGFHCFLFRKRKTASQPWQAIAQRFCSIPIYLSVLNDFFEWFPRSFVRSFVGKANRNNSCQPVYLFLSISSGLYFLILLLFSISRIIDFSPLETCPQGSFSPMISNLSIPT